MRSVRDPGLRPYADPGSRHGSMTWHVGATPFVSRGALLYLLLLYVDEWS